MRLETFTAWQAGQEYESGSRVLYGDRFYIAAEDVPAGAVPDLSSFWRPVPTRRDRERTLKSDPMYGTGA